MYDTIHLKTCFHFIETQNDNHSKLIVEKFKESCLSLNASLFEPFMEDDTIFEDKIKFVFLADLKKLFTLCRTRAGKKWKVNMSIVKCLGCDFGHPVYRFDVYRDETLVYDFGFRISIEGKALKDIYRCNLYREKEGRWLEPEGMPAIYLDYNRVVKK